MKNFVIERIAPLLAFACAAAVFFAAAADVPSAPAASVAAPAH